MTKKKSKKGEDEQFQMKKSKSVTQTPPLAKNRGTTRIQKEKKQLQLLPGFNKKFIEERKAYQQKYRENLVIKRIEQQKRGFRPLRYDIEANSQLGDIDSDSVNHRNENETIQRIKQILQQEEMIVNSQHCFLKAKTQLAKVEKLFQTVYERKDDYMQMVEKVKPEDQKFETKIDRQNQGESEIGAKTVLEKIAELESVYY